MAFEEATLEDALTLRPPTSPDKAPSALGIVRRREIDIDWYDLLSEEAKNTLRDDLAEVVDSTNNIKNFFLRIWEDLGYTKEFIENSFRSKQGEFFDKGSVVFRHPKSTTVQQADVPVYLISSKKPEGDKFSTRVYIPLDDEGKPVDHDPDDATIVRYYDELWPKVKHLAVGFLPTDVAFPDGAAAAGFPQVSSIETSVEQESRESALIKAEFDRLDALISLSNTMKAVADEKVKSEAEGWWADPSKITVGEQKYLEFAARGTLLKDKLLELQKKAAGFGYYLCVEARDTRESRDSAGNVITINLTRGRLYREYRTTVRWTTSVTLYRTVVRRGSCGKRRVSRIPYVKTYHHLDVVPRFEEIKNVDDPIQLKIEDLRKQGKLVFVFREEDSGYTSENGERLSEITYRCENDERFRRRCVCVFPEYDSIFSGYKYELRNIFFFHPLPGMFPTEFPRAYVQEDLSYTIQWVHSELGQLVSTISLAPGEERNIVVSTSYKRDITNASSLTRSSEVTAGSSQDFATEIENEASREFSRSKSSSASGSAGFSYGGFGAKASASQTSTTSLKNFSRTLRKVARKAARNMNKKISQEVTSSTTEVISTSNSEQTTYSVRNSNEGRTLNIMFYQVNNMFNGGLYVDDLKLVMQSGREVIAGSGIFESFVYPLHDLDNALERMAPDKLPVEVPYSEDGAFVAYWDALMDALIETLGREYAAALDGNMERPSSSCCVLNVDEYRIPEIATLSAEERSSDALSVFRNRLGRSDTREKLGVKFEELKELLQDIIVSESPLVPDNLLVASGGVYADSIVGQRPATEPYAEKMRGLEASARSAEVAQTLAQTAAVRARTNLLFAPAAPTIVDGNLAYIENSPSFECKLSFDAAVSDGSWLALVNDTILSLEFADDRTSATLGGVLSEQLDSNAFFAGLLLIDRDTGNRIISAI